MDVKYISFRALTVAVFDPFFDTDLQFLNLFVGLLVGGVFAGDQTMHHR